MKKKSLRGGMGKQSIIEQTTKKNMTSIQIYLRSDIRTDLLQGIISCRSTTSLSSNNYYNYRAALIGEVILRNSQRAGVAIGLRASEVDSTKSGEILKIIVHSHKKGKIKPAVLFMKNIAKKAMKNFKKSNFTESVYRRVRRSLLTFL